MTRIALLDYGMGNLHSAAKALEHVGATVDITHDPKLIAAADKIVFPGVGAMRDCMAGMREAGVDEAVKQAAFNKPVLAICVGMQALLDTSAENGGVDCFGRVCWPSQTLSRSSGSESAAHGLESSASG
jgi:glutamine amidotransferase